MMIRIPRPSALVSFFTGLVLGSMLTLMILRIPWELLRPRVAEEVEVEEPEFDPFADFEIPMNDRVQARIRHFLTPGGRAHLIESYRRSGRYMPMISPILEEYQLPQVLAFLPILESGFRPHSRSRAGAVGLWQIMPATASDYGLALNRWVDERRDPERATLAAVEYLHYLHSEFGNWDSALAGYNYGHNRLKRAMRRERTADYWQLRRIPRETRNFVPNFYAILHLLSEPEKYRLRLPAIEEPLEYETIDLEASFSIAHIARLADVSPGVIKSYNPALISDIAPSGKYTLRVPGGVKEQFLERYEENPPEQVEITYINYRVKRGDTLFKIARQFGTTVRAIRDDNHLRSTRWIDVGQMLRIAAVTVHESVPPTAERILALPDVAADTAETSRITLIYVIRRDSLALAEMAREYSVSIEELQIWNPWISSQMLYRGEEVMILKPVDRITMHRTRRGDSLWRLARRYRTTVNDLKMWNQLSGSRIYPGQRLIVAMN